MMDNFQKNRLYMIIFISTIFCVVFSFVNQFIGIFDHFFVSPDITLTNSYLCEVIENDCIPLDNETIDGNHFNNLKVCTQYSSSEATSIEIDLVHQEPAPFIGMYFDDIEKGNHKVCYFLKDVVDSWENSNAGGKYPSPVNNGVIEVGAYRVVFQQGRKTLDQLDFEVIYSN